MLQYNGQSIGNPEWGYKLNFSPTDGLVYHDFCGPHNIAGAACPHCEKPLLRLLTLNSLDTKLNLDPARHPMVHLLYCWTCSIPFDEFTYRINSDGGIKILQTPPRKGPDIEFGPQGPYDGYTGVFKGFKVSLEPLPENIHEELLAGEGAFNGHQIGGHPFIYNPANVFCLSCSQEMPLLASFSDNATAAEGFNENASETFVNNSGVQMVFHLCRRCSIVSAYHSCD